MLPDTSTKTRVFRLLVAAALLSGLALPLAVSAAPEEEVIRLNNLGIAYLAQYKPAEAERQFRSALALDKDYLTGHVNAGIAALAQVHYDDAIASFEKALAMDPNNVYALFNLSLIYKLQGKPDEALAAALLARNQDTRDPDIRYHIGSLYMTTRRYDEAIQELDIVLKLDPNFLSAYYSLGRAWMAKGDTEKGKKYIQRHRELQAGAGATPAVGLRYGEQGKYSFAMEDTGSVGPLPALEEGAVTWVDVTSRSGIDFVHGGRGGTDLLRKGILSEGQTAQDYLSTMAGPALGSGVAVADVDGDGLEDLFFCNTGPGETESALYRNRGQMKFEKMPFLVKGKGMSAVFGDLDGDADPDLTLALADRVAIFLNDGSGNFTKTEATGLPKPIEGLFGGVSLADVDHDGDLDIYLVGFLSAPAPPGPVPFPAAWKGTRNYLLINATGNTDGEDEPPPVRFVESAKKAGVARTGRKETGAVFSDFDNDRDIDFVIASPGDGTTLFSNDRDGTFSDRGPAGGLPGSHSIMGLAAGDYDKDGLIDLAASTWDGGLPRLFRNMNGSFALDVSALMDVSHQIAAPQFGVALVDFDNDGYLDVVTVNGDVVGPALFVLRNQGDGRFLDAGQATGAGGIPARSGRGLAVADLDKDGDLDLVISNSGSGPTLLRNDGGNRNHWIRIAAEGLHSNKEGVGTKVEVKSGRLWQKTEVSAGSGYLSQSSLVPHFGLGPRQRVDTVRLLWPGGVLQDEIQVAADELFTVQELDRKGSSCPILYAWDGTAIRFVSDFLGGSAIGYRTGEASFNYPDTEEFVTIDASLLAERDGHYELRMVNQLEETIYFDQARLLAVDHPGSVEVFPDERLMPGPPFPQFRLFALQDIRPPLMAFDDTGRDRLSELSRIDRVYVGPPEERNASRRFKGYAREHHLTLDLGPEGAGKDTVLLLHGWIDYADSTSNLAASQAGLALIPPYLEVLDESDVEGSDRVAFPDGDRTGRWIRAIDSIGFPAGLPKTMTVELGGALPTGSRILRIGTSMRIYWDSVKVATGTGTSLTLTSLEPSLAELRYRGFPLITSDSSPAEYDYARDEPAIHWKVQEGAYTRYGDVRPLLVAADDRYVITSPGDEIALRYPLDGLPPLPEGWKRSWLLHADGFGKDMDLNSARPNAVTPLPHHTMRSYPPDANDLFPFEKPGLLDWFEEYNTRHVSAPLMPLRSR